MQDREFLTSRQWREKRKCILARDGYQCQYFKRFGKAVEGNVVHHIFPRSQFPEYALANWNLITVSWAGHKALESDEGLTEEGKALLRRTARRYGIDIPDEYK